MRPRKGGRGEPRKMGPRRVGPRRVGPRRVGCRRVGPRKVGGAKISRFFFPLPPQFSFFPSLGGLLVEFWWCLKRRGPEMCTFGVLGLSPPRLHTTEREERMKIVAGEKKRARFWAVLGRAVLGKAPSNLNFCNCNGKYFSYNYKDNYNYNYKCNCYFNYN